MRATRQIYLCKLVHEVKDRRCRPERSFPSCCIAMATPADLKVVTPYLTRAKELATAEPVIAYWCTPHLPGGCRLADDLLRAGTYYAVQQGMSVGSKESGSNAFLLELMDRLETVSSSRGRDSSYASSDPYLSTR